MYYVQRHKTRVDGMRLLPPTTEAGVYNRLNREKKTKNNQRYPKNPPGEPSRRTRIIPDARAPDPGRADMPEIRMPRSKLAFQDVSYGRAGR